MASFIRRFSTKSTPPPTTAAPATTMTTESSSPREDSDSDSSHTDVIGTEARTTRMASTASTSSTASSSSIKQSLKNFLNPNRPMDDSANPVKEIKRVYGARHYQPHQQLRRKSAF